MSCVRPSAVNGTHHAYPFKIVSISSLNDFILFDCRVINFQNVGVVRLI